MLHSLCNIGLSKTSWVIIVLILSGCWENKNYRWIHEKGHDGKQKQKGVRHCKIFELQTNTDTRVQCRFSFLNLITVHP